MRKLFTLLTIVLLSYAGFSQNCTALYTATVDDSTGVATFVDNSSTQIGTVDFWFWDFGDGSSGTGQNITHTYPNGGQYLVCLTIETSDSCVSTFCDSIFVYGGTDPCAGFMGFAQVVNASGPAAADGAVYTSVTGGTPPYSYQWSNGQTTSNLLNAQYGSYYVVVVDAMGCAYTITAFVDADSTASSCEAAFYVSDSVNYFFFSDYSSGNVNSWFWDFGDGTSSTEQYPVHMYNSPGVYGACLTISTSDGCSSTACDTIVYNGSNCNMTGTVTVTDVSTFGGSDGAIDITVTGGTAPYYFYWSNGVSSEDLTGVPAGVYTVYIYDDLQCSLTLTAVVSEPANPCNFYVMIDFVQPSAQGQCDAVATANVFGNSGPAGLNFQWGDGQTGPTATGLCEGDIAVWVSDVNGCVAADSIYIFYDDSSNVGICNLYIDYYVQNASAVGTYSGYIDITVYGGTAPYSYTWSNGMTDEDIVYLDPGIYTVQVLDANGCSESLTVSVGVESVNIPVDTLWTTPWDTCITVLDYYIDTFQIVGQNNLEVTWAIIDPNGVVLVTVNYQFDPNLSGTVMVTLIINCDGAKGMTALFTPIDMDQLTGIKLPDANMVSVYPNPVGDVLHIAADGKTHIRIFDATGKTISSEVIESFGNIQTTNLEKGMYILQATGQNGATETIRLIKY